MIRPALVALILAMNIIGGCTDTRQANYSCVPQNYNNLPLLSDVAPQTDAAGYKTCEWRMAAVPVVGSLPF